MTDKSDLDVTKRRLRRIAQQARSREPQKDHASERIGRCLMGLPEYRRASCILWYIDVRDEVRTRFLLPGQIQTQQVVAIPYCVGDSLACFRLRSMEDLVPGRFGILEPIDSLRGEAERSVDPAEIDLVVVPGVAFDRHGGRLGHGKGFYDRLLPKIRRDAVRIGLAFDCQMFDQIPMAPHDHFLDMVITPTSTHRR